MKNATFWENPQSGIASSLSGAGNATHILCTNNITAIWLTL